MKIDFASALHPSIACFSMSPNPFSSSCHIQIRLTRNSDETQDDRIVIRYKDEDMYQIFYRDGLMDTGIIYCTVLSGAELDVYVSSLFSLVARDRDPFRSIEFQIPCFPALQYDVEDMKKGNVRKALRRVMPILHSAAKY